MDNAVTAAFDLYAKFSARPGWCHDLWEAVLSQIQRIPESESGTQSVQVDVLAQFICNIANRLTASTDLPMEEQFAKWLDLGGRNKIIQSPWSTSSAQSWSQLLVQLVISNVLSTDRVVIHLCGETWKSIPTTAKESPVQSVVAVNAIARDLLLFDDPSMKVIDLGATQRLLGQRSVLCRTENLKPLFQAIARLAKLGSMADLGDSIKISCGELLHDICSSNYFRSLASRRLVTIHKVFRDYFSGGSPLPTEDSSLVQALQLLMVSSRPSEIILPLELLMPI
jgi:hypothetical protein